MLQSIVYKRNKMVANITEHVKVVTVYKDQGFLKPGRMCVVNFPNHDDAEGWNLHRNYHGKNAVFKKLLPDNNTEIEVIMDNGTRKTVTNFYLRSLVFFENLFDAETVKRDIKSLTA